jgi:DNA repair exonuclease SbcCD ATPase subunit
MARTGINYLDVAKTAEKLKNKGIIPTIDRVREILGTGSKTTLAHHLKRWKTITPEEIQYQTLPTEIIKAVKNIHEQLKAHAQQKTEELAQRFQQEIDQLLQQLKQERENSGVLKRNILNHETSNNKLITQISVLEKSLVESKQINIGIVLEKSELTSRLEEKAEQIATLKEQLKSVERNGDHYREMLNQQRTEEKIQFARHLELLEQENNTYKAKIAEKNKQATGIKQDNFELQSKIKYIEQQYASKVAENELLATKLLAATARQEASLNNFIKTQKIVNKARKKKGMAA